MNTLRTDIIMTGLLLVLCAYGLRQGGLPDTSGDEGVISSTDTQQTVQVTESRASTILPKPEITPSPLPDFAAIRDVKTKKQEFFGFMLPLIRQSNDRIRHDRSLLLSARDDLRAGVMVDAETERMIGGLSKRYRVRPGSSLLNQIEELMLRVDVVPESLVLAQAANESGWGTSRFAREANNLFGVWCFKPGCGLAPLSRDEGLTHEVASYESVQDSVNAYVHTINTNAAYTDLRQIRAESRAGETIISGMALAEGLVRYSARGLDYVREIQQIIRVNKLHEYNLPV